MKEVRSRQEKLFKDLFDRYKGTPMAVSSESLAHKAKRYEMLSKIFKEENSFSVHDVGMGVADFYSFLREVMPQKKITYSGTEILQDFVDEAQSRYPHCNFYCRDLAEGSELDTYDYVVMSGLFHQRRETSIRDWEKFSQLLLSNCFAMSRKGIAFNFISPFVDFYQSDVYYCNIYKLLSFINDDLGRFFEIHHNYALFEFTVFVYKESFISSQSPQEEFQKYFSGND